MSATGTAQLPVLASVRAAFSFLTQNWARFAPAAALAALAMFAMNVAFASGDAVLALLGVIAGAGAAIAYRAALLRFALHGTYDGLFGLRLRLSGDEGRLAAVTVLYLVFLALVLLVTFVPVMLVVMGMAAATGDMPALEAARAAGDTEAAMAALGAPARSVMAFGWAFIVVIAAFVAVRLTLCFPATIAEGRVAFLTTWPWTKGSFLRLLAALILAVLPGLVAESILSSLAGAALAAGSAFAAGVLAYAAAFAFTLIGGAMSAGLLAYVYRGLRPAEPQAPA